MESVPSFSPLLVLVLVAQCEVRPTEGAIAVRKAAAACTDWEFGPYWIQVQGVAQCPRDEVAVDDCDFCTLVSMRYNHTAKVRVMDINQTLANGVFAKGASTVTLDVSKWDTVSGWRPHFLVMQLGEMCFVFEDMLPRNFHEVLGTERGVKCPVADGFYQKLNVATRLEPLRHFPALPYGRYRVYFIVRHAKESRAMRSCVRNIVDIVQRVP